MKKYMLLMLALILFPGFGHAAIVLDGPSGEIISCVSLDEIAVQAGATSSRVLNCTVFNGPITIEETTTVTNCVNQNIARGRSINITTGKTVTGTYNRFSDAAKSGAGTYSDPGTTTQWSVNPLFVSPATDDFNLLPASPCVNAGILWCVPADGDQYDIAGNLVYNSSAAVGLWAGGVDIGAYGFAVSGGKKLFGAKPFGADRFGGTGFGAGPFGIGN